MRLFVLACQCRALVHPEALLLVGHHQPRRGKLHSVGYQRVSAYYYIEPELGLNRGQRLINPALLCGRRRTDQQLAADAEPGKERCQILIMLPGKYLGRSHQGRLTPALYRNKHCRRSTNSLPAADVSYNNPPHRNIALHVGSDFVYNTKLGTRQAIGQHSYQLRYVVVPAGYRPALPPLLAGQRQPERVHEELVENKAAFGRRQGRVALGLMNVSQGIGQRAEPVFFAYVLRQPVLKLVGGK